MKQGKQPATATERGRKARHDATNAIRKEDKQRAMRNFRQLDEGEQAATQLNPELLPEWVHVIMFCAKQTRMDVTMSKKLTDAIHHIRVLSSCPVDEAAHHIVMSGVMHMLRATVMNPLFAQMESMLLDIASIITNVTYSTNALRTKAIVQCGCLDALVHLLHTSPFSSVVDQAMMGMVNILDDSPTHRQLLIDDDGVFLDTFLRNLFPLEAIPAMTDVRLEHGGWVLRAFCKGPPSLPLQVAKRIMPLVLCMTECILARPVSLAKTLQVTLNNLFFTMDYLTDSPEHVSLRTELLQRGMDRHMMFVIGSDFDPEVVHGASEALLSFTNGLPEHTDLVLEHGVLPVIFNRVISGGGSPDAKKVHRVLMWGLSNICAGTPAQIQKVLGADMIPFMIAVAHSTGSSDVRDEVGFGFANLACSGLEQQVDFMIKQPNVPSTMVRLLKEQRTPELQMRMMEGFARILLFGVVGTENMYVDMLEEAGLEDVLLSLANQHGNEIISAEASRLLEEYFCEGDDDF